jgi:hypothetical protein
MEKHRKIILGPYNVGENGILNEEIPQKAENSIRYTMLLISFGDSNRFVCISDTHSTTNLETFPHIPSGDVLIHCGDFTQSSTEVCSFLHDSSLSKSQAEFEKFFLFLDSLPHTHKIVIGGIFSSAVMMLLYFMQSSCIQGTMMLS